MIGFLLFSLCLLLPLTLSLSHFLNVLSFFLSLSLSVICPPDLQFPFGAFSKQVSNIFGLVTSQSGRRRQLLFFHFEMWRRWQICAHYVLTVILCFVVIHNFSDNHSAGKTNDCSVAIIPDAGG